MASTLSDDTAPSASLDCLKARAAPTHPGAQPEPLGSLPWPQELASGRPKVEDFPLPTTRHGQGVLRYASGASYEGGFEEGVFSGEGTYKWADGASYVGGWKAGRMHGEGCYTDTDKVEWKGAFHNGSFFNGKAYATLR